MRLSSSMMMGAKRRLHTHNTAAASSIPILDAPGFRLRPSTFTIPEKKNDLLFRDWAVLEARPKAAGKACRELPSFEARFRVVDNHHCYGRRRLSSPRRHLVILISSFTMIDIAAIAVAAVMTSFLAPSRATHISGRALHAHARPAHHFLPKHDKHQDASDSRCQRRHRRRKFTPPQHALLQRQGARSTSFQYYGSMKKRPSTTAASAASRDGRAARNGDARRCHRWARRRVYFAC